MCRGRGRGVGVSGQRLEDDITSTQGTRVTGVAVPRVADKGSLKPLTQRLETPPAKVATMLVALRAALKGRYRVRSGDGPDGGMT